MKDEGVGPSFGHKAFIRHPSCFILSSEGILRTVVTLREAKVSAYTRRERVAQARSARSPELHLTAAHGERPNSRGDCHAKPRARYCSPRASGRSTAGPFIRCGLR